MYLRGRVRASVLSGGAEGENFHADSPLSLEPDMGLDFTTHGS